MGQGLTHGYSEAYRGMPDYPQTIQFWRGHLPHWEVVDGRYFVTLRLAGSLPESAVGRLQELSQSAPRNGQPDKHAEWSRRYFALEEELLHTSKETSWLGRDDIAEMVTTALTHYHEKGKWQLLSYVLMPNHAHLFFMTGFCGMTKCMKDLKHYTARQANALLGRKGKRFWQTEWFDHWSRSAQEDDKIRSYIRMNPVRAGFAERWQDWKWHSE